MLQLSTDMCSFPHGSWLQLVAEYGGCSQRLLMSPLMHVNSNNCQEHSSIIHLGHVFESYVLGHHVHVVLHTQGGYGKVGGRGRGYPGKYTYRLPKLIGQRGWNIRKTAHSGQEAAAGGGGGGGRGGGGGGYRGTLLGRLQTEQSYSTSGGAIVILDVGYFTVKSSCMSTDLF